MSLCDSEWCSERISALETQLAEERTKRVEAEATTRQHKAQTDYYAAQVAKAKRELAEVRQILLDERAFATKAIDAASGMQKRAETAERELAEERATRAGAECQDVLEAQASAANSEREVARLQALVDAATKFTFDKVAVIRIAGPASSWWVCPPNEPHEMVDTRDEAIALARDIAAKEKEPTR